MGVGIGICCCEAESGGSPCTADTTTCSSGGVSWGNCADCVASGSGGGSAAAADSIEFEGCGFSGGFQFCFRSGGTVDVVVTGDGLGFSVGDFVAGLWLQLVSSCIFGGGPTVYYTAYDLMPPAGDCLSSPSGSLTLGNSYTLPPGSYYLFLQGSTGAYCPDDLGGAYCVANGSYSISVTGVTDGFGAGCCGE